MNKQLRWRLRENLCLVLLTACALVGCSAPRVERAHCPAIELSVMADSLSDSIRTVSLTDGGQVLLTREPLLTSADVAGARATLTEGQYVINLDLTVESARRLQRFSGRNVGRTLALLVDDRVIRTPKILDPITGNGILLGAFERVEAERLAYAINTNCKR